MVEVGERYDFLTVIEEVAPKISAKGYKDRQFRCRCDCGKIVDRVSARFQPSYRNRFLMSCGCQKKADPKKLPDGMGEWPEYKVWHSMKQRCKSPSARYYYRYGGRGIQVCERWEKSFIDFITDLGRRPSHQHSIDRIDNDGHYEPENCRWATAREQSLNSKRVRPVKRSDGVVFPCATDAAKASGIASSTCVTSACRGRYKQAGGYQWSYADAP